MPSEINTISKASVSHLTEGCQEYVAMNPGHAKMKLCLFFFLRKSLSRKRYYASGYGPAALARIQN